MNNGWNKGRYLNLGLDQILFEKELIGIFDLDSVTVKKDSRNFINKAQKKGEIEDHSTDLPVTFVLCDRKGGGQRVLLTSFSLPTLKAHISRQFP